MQNTETVTHSLEIKDLQFLLQLVSICAQRGAFKVEEMSSIGQTYDRINQFLLNITPVDTTEIINKESQNPAE